MANAFNINCAARRKNTGINRLCQDLGPIAGFMLTPYNWEKSQTDIINKDTFDEAIHADAVDRVYPFPPILAMTNNSEETVYQELALGRLFVKNGKTIFAFEMDSSRYKHEALKSHTLQKCGVVFFDVDNRLHGVRSGENFKAVNLQEFVVEKLKLNDGAGEATRTMVSMVLADPEEFERLPAVVSGLDFQLSSLEGLTDINIDVVSSSATGLVANFSVDKSGAAFNPVGPTAVPLTDGDVIVKTSSGVAVTITSVTAVNGVATIAATLTPGATYTVDLYKPSLMVTKGYESTASATFVVPN